MSILKPKGTQGMSWIEHIKAVAKPSSSMIVLLVLCLIFGPSVSAVAEVTDLDAMLRSEAVRNQADHDPAGGAKAISPQNDPLVKLGEVLFFSKTLGGTFDSACASCHHPDFAGADGLSLPVGVAALNPDFLGLGREVKQALDNDPLKDGGPNVPRNSQTIINSSLFKRALFFDGRVESLASGLNPQKDQNQISTPDSGNMSDAQAGESLLEAQARFPVTSPDEMRNFLHPELQSTDVFRNHLVERLRGKASSEYMSPQGPRRWLELFQSAFGKGSSEKIIAFRNIQKAIAAYETSLVFVDTPWLRYVRGDKKALSDVAKQGALLFFKEIVDNGLGCASCHSGSFFSDEKFYNVGIPQIGRGKRADGSDFGRWQVTKQDQDKYTYRVPTLINIEFTAPYGHSGVFQTLDEFLRYHANPKAEIQQFDFSLQKLDQFRGLKVPYPNALRYTQNALDWPNFAQNLPHRELTKVEIGQVVAFLQALSSECLTSSVSTCLSDWVPRSDEDPDGNFLIRSFTRIPDSTKKVRVQPDPLSLPYPAALVELDAVETKSYTTFPETIGCPAQLEKNAKSSSQYASGSYFSEEEARLGFSVPHGFSRALWYGEKGFESFSFGQFQSTMSAGGVSASYLNDDCWPDLVYASGTKNGLILFTNERGKRFRQELRLPKNSEIGTKFTGVGIADLSGNYQHDLVLGNLTPGNVLVLRRNRKNHYVAVAKLPMQRNTFGMAFGDYNSDGYPDLYLGHWDFYGLPGSAPALWKNNGGVSLSASDKAAGVSAHFGINQAWQFNPSFADVDLNGTQDLLIAGDFNSSLVLKNGGNEGFKDSTDRAVINDENGMGSALGDYRNVGKQDWFVTSVYDPSQHAAGHWGVHGNRMYRNESTNANVSFVDVTDEANVRNGMWGWGACASDFNNDGWLDILQLNGFGFVPEDKKPNADLSFLVERFTRSLSPFVSTSSRFFINQGGGKFLDKASEWKIDLPMNGRGLVCFDYDRDGDIDVALVDHSKGIKVFENHQGAGEGHHMLSVRLVGQQPNTEALGARVYVTSDLNGNGRIDNDETQMRVANANSNFISQNPPDLHFGLGKANRVNSLRVVWPNGREQTFNDIPADQYAVFHQ